MRGRLVAAVAASLLVSASAGATAPAGEVSLSTAEASRLGVMTRPLAAARRGAQTDAFAKVLDPEPLVQLNSDLATAEAAASASAAEAARARALHGDDAAMSAKDTEAATAQARQDALKVEMLRRRLGLEWGPGIARLSDAARGRLARGLASGAAALVHVDTHNDAGQAGARFVAIDVGDQSVRGVVLGPARAAEPRLQSSGLIVEVTGPAAMLLSVGLTQSAHIQSTAMRGGVVIPRESVIRYRGLDWAYVRSGAGAFVRRPLLEPTPESDGLFVAQGFTPGEAVVVRGAATLFAAEQTPSARAR